jgi:hypothetical protein
VNEHHRQAGVLGDLAEPGKRMLRIERHVSRPSLEDPKQGRDGAWRPFTAYANQRFRSGTTPAQEGSPAIRHRVEALVTCDLITEHQSRRGWPLSNLSLEEVLDTRR